MNRREFLTQTTVTGLGAAGSVAVRGATAEASQPPLKTPTLDGYCVVGIDREFNLTDSALLKLMDEAGVDRAVIAPPDRFLVLHNRQGNERIRKTAAANKARFIPTCTVNPWYGKAALEELRRAIGEGARMLVLHPFVQGYIANDELTFPVIEQAMRERVPIYIHTGSPGNSTPWKIVDLGDRFPGADFIMGHCGATDFWNDVIPALTISRNVYGESSLARPFLFTSYMEAVGSRKGIHGSYAPINDLLFEWEEMRKFLPQQFHTDVFGKNLYELLTKRGPL